MSSSESRSDGKEKRNQEHGTFERIRRNSSRSSGISGFGRSVSWTTTTSRLSRKNTRDREMKPTETLRTKIKEVIIPRVAKLKLYATPGFVPETDLRDVLSEPTVEGVLKSLGLKDSRKSSESYKLKEQNDRNPTVSELTAFIREKAPKVFATLICANCCKLEVVIRFYTEKINDSRLPLILDWNEETQISVAKCQSTSDDLAAFDSDTLSSGACDLFNYYHGLFLAPVLGRGQWGNNYSDGIRLPFVDPGNVISFSSNYSEVKQRWIHRDYLQHDEMVRG